MLDKKTMMEAEAQEGPHTESLEFTIPDGVEIEDGDEKEVLCKIRSLGNGKAALVEVEGTPVGSDSPSTENEPDTDDMPDINDRYNAFVKKAKGGQEEEE